MVLCVHRPIRIKFYGLKAHVVLKNGVETEESVLI